MSAIDRIVLVGLPGAGKTTTGRILAGRLGWRFADVDGEIVSATGLSIADLFQRDGEMAFRAMEARLTAALCSEPNIVVAPGGGWAAQPGQLESLPRGSAVIWLRIAPEEAIARLRGSPEERPLLAGTDPLATLRGLEQQRRERYALAGYTVDVDGRTAMDVAQIIIKWLRRSTS